MLTAHRQGTLNRLLLEAGDYRLDDYHKLARYWVEVMKARSQSSHVSRWAWKQIRRMVLPAPVSTATSWPSASCARDSQKQGKLRLADYWPGDYPKAPFFVAADESKEDPRARPWYLAARAAGRPVWSETYVLFGTQGHKDVPGVSYATPLYREDKMLVGVFSATIDLYELSRFLATLAVSPHGLPFVVEFRADGSRRVIAHPRPDVLLKKTDDGDGRELVPVPELPDPELAEFLKQVPATLDPSKLTGMKQVPASRRGGIGFLGCYRCLSTAETPNWLIGILLPESDVLAWGPGEPIAPLCSLGLASWWWLSLGASTSPPRSRSPWNEKCFGHGGCRDRPVADRGAPVASFRCQGG